MADKIPWCKFWTSCLTDPDLENLELHQWARWARLIIFLRAHGDNGKMRLDPPAISLQNTLRVRSYDELLEVIKLFKNVTLTPLLHLPLSEPLQKPLQEPLHEPLQAYFMFCKNWYKYQQESSVERVRKHRRYMNRYNNRHGKHVEESRVDLTSTSTSSPASRSRLGGAPLAEKKGDKMNQEDMEIAEANKAWKKPTPDKPEIKSWDEARPNDLCGPPPDMWARVKGLKK